METVKLEDSGHDRPPALMCCAMSGWLARASSMSRSATAACSEIRLALEHWIDKTKSDPEVLKKAEAVRAEIEREAQTRRNAIAAIFNEGSGEAGVSSARSTRRSGRPSE